MKVLYILDPAVTGGATKSIIGLINQMLLLGVEPVVCTSGLSYLNKELSDKGISNFAIGHCEMITYVHSGRYWGRVLNFKKYLRYVFHDFKALCFVRKNIKLKEIDLIHTNSSRSDIGFFISKFYKIAHVVHLREYGDLDYNCFPLNPLYITYYNAWANRFFCVSESVKTHWGNKGINQNKTRVIYNGIDISGITISSDESKTHQKLKIVMCGLLRHSKGQHLAVEAIGRLAESIRDNVEIDFFGWYDEAYVHVLKSIAKQYNIEQNVNILGSVDDVLPFLGKYQVGLMCSQSEGFGRSTAEYMHAKLGVIASDSGANPELIENGKTGLLFASGDAGSLSEKISEFYNDRQLLIECSKSAQEKALREYTASKNAENVYAQYLEVVKHYAK